VKGPRRGRRLQVLRKIVQLSAAAFVVYAPLSMYWRNFKEAHNSARIVGLMTNEFWARMYAWNETALTWFGDPAEVSDGFLGGPWAATVAGVPLTDPWSVATVAAQAGVPPGPMLLGALIPLAVALLLGKVFCSWLCPARLAFEAASAARLGLLRLGVTLPALRIPRIGLLLGLVALAFGAFAGAAVFGIVLPYLALSGGLHVWIIGGTGGGAAAWFGVLFFVELAVAPGQICRSLCPTGALLELVGRRSLLRLEKDGTKPCPSSCDLCRRVCPYGLFPGRETHRPACDSCGKCAPACPDGKLGHALIVPMPTRKVAAAVLAVGLAGATLAPAAALAHHNKGLPHYGYFENYPQVPTDETIRIVGRWEIGATLFNFQGLKRETSATPDDVRVFAYVYDLQEDVPYRGSMTLSVMLKDEVIATFDRLQPDEETVYRTRVTLPKSGTYHLVFELDEETVPLHLPFEADLAADRVDWTLIGVLGGVPALLFVLAAAGRKRRFTPRAAPESTP